MNRFKSFECVSRLHIQRIPLQGPLRFALYLYPPHYPVTKWSCCTVHIQINTLFNQQTENLTFPSGPVQITAPYLEFAFFVSHLDQIFSFLPTNTFGSKPVATPPSVGWHLIYLYSLIYLQKQIKYQDCTV